VDATGSAEFSFRRFRRARLNQHELRQAGALDEIRMCAARPAPPRDDQRVDPTGAEPRERPCLELLRPCELDCPEVLPRLVRRGLPRVCTSTREREPGDGENGKETTDTAATGCGSHVRLLFDCGGRCFDRAPGAPMR
jgi:hypothetical protein